MRNALDIYILSEFLNWLFYRIVRIQLESDEQKVPSKNGLVKLWLIQVEPSLDLTSSDDSRTHSSLTVK